MENLRNCVFVIGALTAGVAQTALAQQKKPMNILYIMSDDHSYQTISAYDNRFVHTPNIDWIANHGVRFTESFVANSLSGPSRACMLTGKHSHKNGFTDTPVPSTAVSRPILNCCRRQGTKPPSLASGT